MSPGNTLFLRLAGPMQSWGTSSRLQLRRTDAYPSRSGVLGLILCAMGVRREDSESELAELAELRMGVRVDLVGTFDWDYHTAGAKGEIKLTAGTKIGIRKAEGGIKLTDSTKLPEPQLSRRQYLCDASFLVVLQGESGKIKRIAEALENPVWPIYLGRKCCVPSEPVFDPVNGTGVFSDLKKALASRPCNPRLWQTDEKFKPKDNLLDVYLEHTPGIPIPEGARQVHDNPVIFGYWSHKPRYVIHDKIDVQVGSETMRKHKNQWRDPYSNHFKEVARPHRLATDNYLCVFCKAHAVEVHHISYDNCPHETDDDLRSLCKLCHNACTMLEYAQGTHQRIDPSDPAQREAILQQIELIISNRRFNRRREILESSRLFGSNLSEGD